MAATRRDSVAPGTPRFALARLKLPVHALKKSRELSGATPGTLECFLTVRGARTMALRLERAQQSATLLSERLERHPMVEVTRYPGLASHPTHAIAKRVLKGFGTIVSFDVRGGAVAADAVCRAVRLIRHAPGDVGNSP
jgi:cystathionine gamma-synthase